MFRWGQPWLYGGTAPPVPLDHDNDSHLRIVQTRRDQLVAPKVQTGRLGGQAHIVRLRNPNA